MKKNVGRFDQVLRMAVSLFLIYIGFFDGNHIITDSLSSTIIGVIGVANLFVSLIRYCPLYVLAGVSTCPKHKK